MRILKCIFAALLAALTLTAGAETLTLPKGLVSIGDYAFHNNTSLDEVVLPEGVRSIGTEAFSWSSVYTINLPDSIEYIAEDAFSFTSLTNVTASPDSYAGRWALKNGYMKHAFDLGTQSIEVAASVIVKGSFTVPFTGTYSFYSSGSADTYGYLYDAEGWHLMHDDDSGEGHNYKITRVLTLGETVTLGSKFYSSAKTGSMDITITGTPYPDTIGEGQNTLPLGDNETAVYTFTALNKGTYIFIADNYGSVELCLPDDTDAEFSEYAVCALDEGESVRLAVRHMEGKTGSAVINVSGMEDETPQVTYRALLIGQVHFTGNYCTRNGSDVTNMTALLRVVNGGAYEISSHIDLTRSEVAAAISAAFAGATENDVSLFFYASHGVYSEGSQYGALRTYDGGYIPTAELAEWLSRVPGKVIVLVGTCGSGALIEANNGEVSAVSEIDGDEINRLIISAFAAYDPGITVHSENSGELRDSKFVVMTASAGGESSWGTEQGLEGQSYNFFTKWFIESAGGTGSTLTADSNGDGKLTLSESYAYVAAQAAAKVFSGGKQQHPQVYPANSNYVLFTK